MAKQIPNAPAGAATRPHGIFQLDWDGVVASIAFDGVLSGLGVAPSGSPDMNVVVSGGQARIGGYFPYAAQQNVAIAAADATLDRFDLVVIDWNGTVSRVAGIAAAQPLMPNLPANSICLAKVFVKAGATAIRNDGVQFAGQQMVFDDRCIVADYYDLFDPFIASGLTTTGNIGALNWSTSAAGTAASSYLAGEALHNGIYNIQSGATSGNSTRIHFGAAASTAVFVPANLARLSYLARIPTITTLAAKLGAGQDISDAAAGSLGTAGAWVEFVPATSAKWRYGTRQASASTMNADTGADVVAGNWYQFDIVRLQNGNIQFAKNGVLQVTHTTNLPSTSLNIGALAHTLTAAARNLHVDDFGLNWAPLGQRFS
jgi:hypothetical protein